MALRHSKAHPTPKPISRYLTAYAEPLPEAVPLAASGPFSQVVVVPCCGEAESLVGLLDSLAIAATETDYRAGTKVLVLLIVNDGPDTPPAHLASNRATLSLGAELDGYEPLKVYLVDRRGISGGVGEARKIGADLATHLWASGSLEHPWIHVTDGDARVAPDYFQLHPSTASPWGLGPLPAAAFVHPFSHDTKGPVGPALALYDSYLRYYCEGLTLAGSPFAYPTIGSTLSVRVDAYAIARGFPKRQAAEDFYFLHKVAKIGFVWPGGGEVRLIARASDRVPFGTGRSVARIGNLQQQGKPYLAYSPRVFEALRDWHRSIDLLAGGESWDRATASLPLELLDGLHAMGAPEQARKLLPHCQTDQGERHWFTWFDGFRTLRLVHLLRLHSGFEDTVFTELTPEQRQRRMSLTDH